MFGKNHSQQLQEISDQVAQALRELAALRQQVDSQQHAIDHLNDTREVVRRALGETRETLIGQLAAFSADLATIRANTQRHGEAEPNDPGADGEAAPQAARDDAALLQAAAGISAAQLQMHRDTWSFLVEHAAGDRHFHVPGKVEEQEGAVTVHVSGPSIVAALTSLANVSRTDADPGTRAIARHLHQRLADTVQAVIDNPHRGNGADPVIIVIDDRIAPTTDEPTTTEGNDQPPND